MCKCKCCCCECSDHCGSEDYDPVPWILNEDYNSDPVEWPQIVGCILVMFGLLWAVIIIGEKL